MKFAADRPYGDPDKAARKLIEIANSVEAVHIYPRSDRVDGAMLENRPRSGSQERPPMRPASCIVSAVLRVRPIVASLLAGHQAAAYRC
jgi:hypothetical protein